MLRGNLDRVSLHDLAGWVQEDEQPLAPVPLVVTDNDMLVGRILANRHRPDLEMAGIGRGRHAFEFTFEAPLSPMERHVVRVFRESDGEDVPGSPGVIEALREFDDATRVFMTGILARTGPADDIERKLDWLIEEFGKLLQRHADRDSKRAERALARSLVERWSRNLGAGQGDQPAAAGTRHVGPVLVKALGRRAVSNLVPRALVIDDRAPRADRDAGSVVILSHIRSLQRLGFEVGFIPAGEFNPSATDRAALAALTVACYGPPYYATVEEVFQRQAGEFDVVYMHRVANAAKYQELARQYFPKARRIFSVADLHHLRLSRQAAAEDRPELVDRVKRVRLLEFVAAATADAVITHSVEEARLLRAQVAGANVHTVLWSATARPTPCTFAARHGIAFIGGYAHEPNRDAARWLIAEIMPLVRQGDPSVTCLLVGSDLPDELRRLCGDGVAAIGHVPDLRDIFDTVRLTVAPLAYGAGVNGKVVESLAAGVPCVCSPIAAEGLDLPADLAGLVATDAHSIADTILRLHRDKAANTEAGAAGLAFVRDRFSEARLDAAMADVLELASVSA
jgi:glycosyltransferase involved in cell wall biosynthesis